MPKAKPYIFFDCMETLVDVYVRPDETDYALWALQGSGVEHCWPDPAYFVRAFSCVQNLLRSTEPLHREYSIEERFALIVRQSNTHLTERECGETVKKLCATFWRKYKSMCYVTQEVREILALLAENYRMAVVSNFIVKDGVNELLKIHDLKKHFHFTVISANIGWRKPHPRIYQKALAEASVNAQASVFIGDNFVNDYLSPSRLGFKTYLYDRHEQYKEVGDRFTKMHELRDLLAKE